MTAIASSLLAVVQSGSFFHLRGNINASPGGAVTVLSFTVPVSTTRYLHSVTVVAPNDGDFSLKVAGVEIATGRLDNVLHQIPFKFDPPHPISGGTAVVLEYTADSEPSLVHPVTAFVTGEDFQS